MKNKITTTLCAEDGKININLLQINLLYKGKFKELSKALIDLCNQIGIEPEINISIKYKRIEYEVGKSKKL